MRCRVSDWRRRGVPHWMQRPFGPCAVPWQSPKSVGWFPRSIVHPRKSVALSIRSRNLVGWLPAFWRPSTLFRRRVGRGHHDGVQTQPRSRSDQGGRDRSGMAAQARGKSGRSPNRSSITSRKRKDEVIRSAPISVKIPNLGRVEGRRKGQLRY